jgi:hypothetical protein
MRRLADRLGIRAPSLYQHFSHNTAQGRDLIDGFVGGGNVQCGSARGQRCG